MQAFLGFAVLSIGVTATLPHQPSASVQIDPPAQFVSDSAFIGSKQADLLTVSGQAAAAGPAPVVEEAQTTGADSEGFTNAMADERSQADASDFDRSATERGSVQPISLDELCDTLISSARANDLPVLFFTNLIWQESRFDPAAISRAGAQGVAQFMPKTAAAAGLDDPFDPLQALPASARLLRQLHEQFGNVGLAAAAYNAGPGRVIRWLSNRGTLPQETRSYVVIITGRPAEHWRAAGPKMAFRPAPGLPCSRTAAFAELKAAASEQDTEESEQAQYTLIMSPRPRLFAAKKSPRARVFAARSRPLASQSASIVVGKGLKNPRQRIATRGIIKITAKSVRLTLVAPEPNQSAARRLKKNAASNDKGRKLRRVRLASNTS